MAGADYRTIAAAGGGILNSYRAIEAATEDEVASTLLARLSRMAELGVTTIHVQADADVARSEAQAFVEAQARAAVPTGIWLIDAWNGSIRPAFGTLALVLVLLLCQHFEWDMTKAAGVSDVVYSIIGFYFADRTLKKAGK